MPVVDECKVRQYFQDLFVGEPQVRAGLKIYPVFPGKTQAGTFGYTVLPEALAANLAVVSEMANATVPFLLLENRSNRMVLAIDGQEVVGGKQDRMINASLLVGAQQKVEMPVSCVEQGRWREASQHFSAGHTGHSSLRRSSHHAVSRSLHGHHGHQSDQHGVWDHLSHGHRTHGSHSPTGAMKDLHAQQAPRLDAVVQSLPYPLGAVGLVAVLPDGHMAADLFDRAETAAGLWTRLVRSYAWDALSPDQKASVAVLTAEQLLKRASTATFSTFASPGCGVDVRLCGQGVSGSALCFEDRPVHVALFFEAPTDIKPVRLESDPLVTLLPKFLTSAECQEFIRKSEGAGYRIAPITTDRGPVVAESYRNNGRVMVDDHALAAQLWERLKPHVPAVWEGWHAVGLNERFRFYRYEPGQHFKQHYDGAFRRNPNEMSMLTFMLYLNEGFRGGDTTFFTESAERRFAVRPQEGAGLIFVHEQLHEGSTVHAGHKYVLRTDVMYRR